MNKLLMPKLFSRPVDVSAREALVAERLEKDKEATKDKVIQHNMSRTSSLAASVRERDTSASRTTPPTASSSLASPTSPAPTSPQIARRECKTVVQLRECRGWKEGAQRGRRHPSRRRNCRKGCRGDHGEVGGVVRSTCTTRRGST